VYLFLDHEGIDNWGLVTKVLSKLSRADASTKKRTLGVAIGGRGWYKRRFDLAVLLLALSFPLLVPVWLFIWTMVPMLIWLEDRGPVFYRQRRLGKGGRPFTALKFRTMVQDAEQLTGPMWASGSDPRITRVGKILRRTALDELPQIINIFKGEMSFVGPRAERPELHEQFVRELPEFENRLRIRPGLTGLAQVNGDYDLSPAEKLKYDLEYVSKMSLWLDVRLMLSSVLNSLMARWDRRRCK